MITHFVAVFCVESNALNTLLVFDYNFWDLNFFWMITHFVAVFCVESNALNTLLKQQQWQTTDVWKKTLPTVQSFVWEIMP